MFQKKLNVFTLQVHREMTPGNKRLYFEHARSHKANLKQYNLNISGDGSARNLTIGRNIDIEVIDSLLHIQKTLETNCSWLFPGQGSGR